MKRFSVIIPCYKKLKTFASTIESIQDQDYPNKEIIVVLDGPDNDIRRLAEVMKVDKILCTGDKNLGAPTARNLGAKHATGDYLSFIDPDTHLYPGALRTWAEAFEDHPECGFVYGGYKIIEGGGTPGQEFDLYHLKTTNYIDGSFPMKKEIFPGWTPEQKSLQDWDMWLKICLAGHTGYWLQGQYFYDKHSGEPGSISEDSHNNWLKRRDEIYKRHGIQHKRVCLTSFAAVHHAKRCAKLLGYDYMVPMMLFTKPHKYKGIMIVGWFPANEYNHYPFCTHSDGRFNEKVKKFIHWIGTDVLHMNIQGCSRMAMNALVKVFNDKFTSFTQAPWLKEELEGMGIKSKIIPLPVDVTKRNIPLPKDFTIGIYDHGQNSLYNRDIMKDIATAMPDIQFRFFGDRTVGGMRLLKNTLLLGHKPIEEVMAQVSCLLRITKHDGLPVGIVEFLAAGRPVITNVDMAYCSVIKSKPSNMAAMKKEIMASIRKIKKRFPDDTFFDNARSHWSRELSPVKLRKAIEKCL